MGALRGDPIWTSRLRDLLSAVDEAIPVPTRPIDRPFLMPVESVLTISGRGTVVTGKVEQGAIGIGDQLEVIGLGPTVTSVCTGLEMFGRQLETAQAGDNAAILVRGVRRSDVRRGQVVAEPGTISARRHGRDHGRARPAGCAR